MFGNLSRNSTFSLPALSWVILFAFFITAEKILRWKMRHFQRSKNIESNFCELSEMNYVLHFAFEKINHRHASGLRRGVRKEVSLWLIIITKQNVSRGICYNLTFLHDTFFPSRFRFSERTSKINFYFDSDFVLPRSVTSTPSDVIFNCKIAKS